MKISVFQAVTLAVFAVAIVGGIIILAFTKSSDRGSGIPVVIWGTLAQEHFSNATTETLQNNKAIQVAYVEKNADTFDRELVEALASGVGPDAILLPHDLIVRHRGKILPMPYDAFSVREYKDTFIEEGELYLDSGGILAVPLTVDPILMYWNRDLLGNAGIAKPPKNWDEFLTLAPKLTVKDKTQNILKSVVAMGEYRNITNAKDIIAALFLQTGNTIMGYNAQGFASTLSPATLATVGAVNFYTDFANPVKPSYSWNRALPNSRDLFSAGDLAFYFGFASELPKIRAKNPNLNFDVTYFPQPRAAGVAATFGRMQGVAVLKTSANVNDAFRSVGLLTSADVIVKLSAATGLPPVRRDLLTADQSDPYQIIFYNSAIRARGWLDPEPLSSSAVFRSMIESITSGEAEAGSAVEVAAQSLSALARGL